MSHPRFAGAARAASYEERAAQEPEIEHEEEAVDPPTPVVEELPVKAAPESEETDEEEEASVPPRPLARPELLPGRRRRPRPAKWGLRGTLSRTGIRMSPGWRPVTGSMRNSFGRRLGHAPSIFRSSIRRAGRGRPPRR